MAKNQEDYYDHKKPWSRVKDDLLGVYLSAYFQKVLSTNRPVSYVDCFAGRGEFMDGEPGSPLIALREAQACLGRAHSANKGISMAFIEAYHWASDLADIVDRVRQAQPYPIPCRVIKGRFEVTADRLIGGMAGSHVFLYVDPYGIKDLDFSLITSFGSHQPGPYGIELLMNLNSFGFVRAACRAMKVRFEDDSALAIGDDEFADELDQTTEPPSVALLDSIAGGQYWRQIVVDLRDGLIDGRAAERRFAAAYRDKLRDTYRYVLSMPIREAPGQPPKYRMVHATNHSAGCVTMADNMVQRKQELHIHLKAHGQGTLFATDVEGEVTDPAAVGGLVQELARDLADFTDVEEVVADFYSSVGVVCKSGVIREALRRLEGSGQIDVDRYPRLTPKSGERSRRFTAAPGGWVRVRARHEHAPA